MRRRSRYWARSQCSPVGVSTVETALSAPAHDHVRDRDEELIRLLVFSMPEKMQHVGENFAIHFKESWVYVDTIARLAVRLQTPYL